MPIISTALKRIIIWDQRDSLQNAQCQQLPYTHMSACLVGKWTMLGNYALTLLPKREVCVQNGTLFIQWQAVGEGAVSSCITSSCWSVAQWRACSL